MLALVALTAFLGDYGSAAGVPTIVVQGVYWDMTPNQVNYAGNLNVIMLYISFFFTQMRISRPVADFLQRNRRLDLDSYYNMVG